MEIRSINANKALVTIDSTTRLIDVNELDLADETSVRARFESALTPSPSPRTPQGILAIGGTGADTEALNKARREKLREIADAVTAARDRGFAEADAIIPSKGLEMARQVDTMFLYLLGELKDDDTIWARDWWTGHQKKITLKTWADAMRESFQLRQLLREHEQDMREEVEGVFKDDTKPIEQRIAEIQKIAVPPYMDLPEQAKIKDVEDKLNQRRAVRSRA